MSRLLARDDEDAFDDLDALRLSRALVLDGLPNAASNSATPRGRLVRRLADELGVAPDELLAAGARWAAGADERAGAKPAVRAARAEVRTRLLAAAR